jgi:GxxExxY protein
MQDNQITEIIIRAAIKVHKGVGPGLLESVYSHCLFYELTKEGLYIEREKPLPLVYEEVKLECGYRADLIVEKTVIVENKSVEALNDIHFAQLITYLKLSKCRLGLLINFNVLRLKDGLRRAILDV